MMKVSVIIPTYNERENIAVLIPNIETLLKKNKIKSEILVVDDSSPDGTIEEANKLNKKYHNIRPVVRKKKEGVGAALRHGYDLAKNDLIVSTDADLSFDHNDILKLIDKINDGYDLVVGSRYLEAGAYEKGLFATKIKAFISKYGNKMVKFMARLPVHDVSANFRAIKRDVWQDLNMEENANAFFFEMLFKAYNKGYKVGEVPVVFKERKYGVSKLNLAKEAPKFFLKLLKFTIFYKK